MCAPERMRAVGLLLAELGYPEILMFQARRHGSWLWFECPQWSWAIPRS